MADRTLSGSPAVNPRAKSVAVKDQAKYHKRYQTKTIRDIIDESIQDTAKPKATNFGNHANGARRLI